MKSLKEKLNGNELDLSLCELTEVPVKELLALPKATHLDLSCNFLLALPVSFSSLTFLTQLDLSKNHLTELPYNFGSLKQLQHLDVYGNELTSLPVSICQLKKLRWLDLKNNPLEPKLQAIAGDCLDQKQCQQCAIKVVEYLSTVNSELEREKQKKLKQERAKEYARKQQEEKEAQRLRQLKKAEREIKKVQKKKQINSSENFESGDKNIANNGTDHALDEEPEEKISVAANLLYYLKWSLFLMISMTLMIFFTNVFLRFKMGHPLGSVNDIVAVSSEEITKLKYKAIKIWHLSSEESLKLFINLKVYFQQLYLKYTGSDIITNTRNIDL